MSISLNRSYVLSEVKGPVGLALRSCEPFRCLVSSQKDKKKKLIKKKNIPLHSPKDNLCHYISSSLLKPSPSLWDLGILRILSGKSTQFLVLLVIPV